MEWRIAVAEESLAREGEMILRDVLINSSEFRWDFALFMSFDTVWNLHTPCLVLKLNDCKDDDTQLIAEDTEMEYVMGIQQIQSIVGNAEQQIEKASEEMLLKAFLYYYDNDAFLVF